MSMILDVRIKDKINNKRMWTEELSFEINKYPKLLKKNEKVLQVEL